MKQIMKTKIPRRVLLLAFLFVGFVVVELNPGSYVHAVPPTCGEAYAAYSNADNAYYSIRVQYVNDCHQQCNGFGGSNYTICVNACRAPLANSYYAAEADLFSKAQQTCAPEGIVYTCQDAQNAAYLCSVLYDSSIVTDPDEAAAVYNQYMACREASKIDTCQ